MDRNSGAIRWRHEIFSKQLTANDIAPAVSDDIVFLGVEGTMYALDAITGERIWTLNRNNSISSTSPVVQKGIVYFLDGGDFCAADMLTGKIRWTTEGVYIPLMPARLPNGNFVVPSDTGGVYTIAPGGAVSRSDVTGILSGAGNHPFPFSVGGDIAFTACLNRCTIAAIREMEDGIYSFESGFSIAPCDQLTVAGKRIYAAGYSGVVCCEVEWNEPTCRVRPLWEYSARESLAPVVAQDVVYCRDDRTIVALEASTGSLIWRYEGTGREYRPTAGNETVVLTTIEGCVKYLSTH
jgi:outer membrane protein assembly factor BamB